MEIKDFSDFNDLFSIYKHLADAYMNREQYDKAYELYEKLIELYKKYPVPEDKKSMYSMLYEDIVGHRKSAMISLGMIPPITPPLQEVSEPAKPTNPEPEKITKEPASGINASVSKKNQPSKSPENTSSLAVDSSGSPNIGKFWMGFIIGLALVLISFIGIIVGIKLRNR